MPAGYSKRSLVEKLGIKPGARVAILNEPKGYRRTLGPLPAKVAVASRLGLAHAFIHLFTTERRDLEATFPALKKALTEDGALWVSWPEGSSGVATDVKDDVLRAIALSHRLGA